MRRLLYALIACVLAAPVSAQTTTITIPADSLMAPVTVFPASAVNGAGTLSTTCLTFPNGQTWCQGTNSISGTNSVFAGSASSIGFTSRSTFSAPGDGLIALANTAFTIGAEFKFDALPTASSCGAGSPAVVAGSTPLSGSVTVGTGAPATCTITFNGTAYPSAPHCSGAVETTTAANARAMGYSATTTVLTIVPSAAWADSSVVNWNCLSSK